MTLSDFPIFNLILFCLSCPTPFPMASVEIKVEHHLKLCTATQKGRENMNLLVSAPPQPTVVLGGPTVFCLSPGSGCGCSGEPPSLISQALATREVTQAGVPPSLNETRQRKQEEMLFLMRIFKSLCHGRQNPGSLETHTAGLSCIQMTLQNRNGSAKLEGCLLPISN